jgi:hypothetical protein
MSIPSWRISRRTFLRGTGAAIALPLLDAMVPLQAMGATPAKLPVRMGVLFFPNGVWPKSWIPEQTGANYELPFSLTPLAKLKDEFLILSGMDKATSHGGDGHYAKTGNFLTGLRVVKTTGKDISCGGTSLDQLIAQKIGHQTPLPSLELGTDPVSTGVDDFVGYTRLYGSYISWRSTNSPVPREINPRAAFILPPIPAACWIWPLKMPAICGYALAAMISSSSTNIWNPFEPLNAGSNWP